MAWTTPRDWTPNEIVTAAIMNTHLRDNLNALGQWTAYTPTWTGSGSNPALGDGTLTGRYSRIGKTVWFQIALAVGTTTTPGTGYWLWSLPSTPGDANVAGQARITDAGTGIWVGGLWVSTNTVYVVAHGRNAGIGPGEPITWANTDAVLISGWYVES